MFNKKMSIMGQLKWVLFYTFLVSSVGIDSKPAMAGCNFHGCSQSSVAECNFHGCPNPPMGAECNFHGCPPSPLASPQPEPVNNGTALPPSNTVILVPNGESSSGGSGQAIVECMQRLLYRNNQYGTPTRTEISEATAVQACQNAR